MSASYVEIYITSSFTKLFQTPNLQVTHIISKVNFRINSLSPVRNTQLFPKVNHPSKHIPLYCKTNRLMLYLVYPKPTKFLIKILSKYNEK